MNDHTHTTNRGANVSARSAPSHDAHDDEAAQMAHSRHMLLMIVACLAMFGGVFLLAGDGGGGLGVLPWLFLLLCPLLHLFMHRGHRGH